MRETLALHSGGREEVAQFSGRAQDVEISVGGIPSNGVEHDRATAASPGEQPPPEDEAFA